MHRRSILAFVAAASVATSAFATADGPDAYRLKPGAAASLRAEPKAGAPVVATVPAGANCLKSHGCRGGLTFEEFQKLSPDERKKREAENPRWCQVEHGGKKGWIENARLAEGDCEAKAAAAPAKKGPAFDCRKAEGTVQKLVCGDDALAALDRKLAGVYGKALKKAANEHPPVLKAEQRGWVKGRDECWKERGGGDGAVRACVEKTYVERIAEIEARYRLVEHVPTIRLACENQPSNEVAVTYFRTEPPTLIAEYGDRVSLMFARPTGSGTRYEGRNEKLSEHQGEFKVTWGYQAPEMTCRKAP